MRLSTTTICLVLALAINASFFRSNSRPKLNLMDVIGASTGKIQSPAFPCMFYNSKAYQAFNFFGFQTSQDQSVEILGYQPTEEAITYKGTFWYNICAPVTQVPEGCETTSNKAFGYIQYTKPTGGIGCDSLGSVVSSHPLLWDYQINFKQAEIDKNSDVDSVEIESSHKENEESEEKFREVKYTFKCDKENKNHSPVNATWSFLNQRVELVFQSKEACGVDTQNVIELFKTYKVVPGLLLILSLPLVFFGLRFLKISLAVIGFIATFIGMIVATSLFTNLLSWQVLQFAVFGVMVAILALAVGYLCYHSTEIAAYVAGGFLGYMGGQYLSMLVTATWEYEFPIYLLIGILIICVIIGALLAHILHDHIMILSTSFGGAQLFAFSVGTLLGNYPDLQTVGGKDIQPDTKLWMWVYGILGAVLFLIGSIYQYKNWCEGKSNGSDVGDSYAKNNDGYNQDYNPFDE